LKNIEFDLWLSSHASQFGLHEKHKPGDTYHPEAFADRKNYDQELENLRKDYFKKLEKK